MKWEKNGLKNILIKIKNMFDKQINSLISNALKVLLYYAPIRWPMKQSKIITVVDKKIYEIHIAEITDTTRLNWKSFDMCFIDETITKKQRFEILSRKI